MREVDLEIDKLKYQKPVFASGIKNPESAYVRGQID